jgi:multisubunit Na+/H+ antiporter MnhF subunit
MNVWLVAAVFLLGGVAVCTWACLSGTPIDRLIALEVVTSVDAVLLLVLAEGLHRDVFFDLALTVALLSLAGGLVFAHFMERWE